MFGFTSIGKGAIDLYNRICRLAAISAAVVNLAARPSSWTRPTRMVLARQIIFTGYDAIGFIAVVAMLAGIAVVVQAQVWMGRLGQSELLGPLLVTVIVREVGPLLVNFIVIGRSATAMAAELAGMKVRREVDVLDAQGLDPLAVLVMPRAISMAVCVFGLAMLFILFSFVSGYLSGAFLQTGPTDPAIFFRSVIRGMAPGDFYNVLAKTLLPGLVTGVIVASEGLSVEGVATDIPQAVTRSVTRSNLAVLMISVVISILTYLCVHDAGTDSHSRVQRGDDSRRRSTGDRDQGRESITGSWRDGRDRRGRGARMSPVGPAGAGITDARCRRSDL
jgi:phospholipid/cholesterol/gamma-HCH transport system permease protein